MRGELLKISDDETNRSVVFSSLLIIILTFLLFNGIRGLDGTYESMKGSVTFPFFTRLSTFLLEAEPKLSDLRGEVKSTQEKVSELMKKYGETFELEKKEVTLPTVFYLVVDLVLTNDILCRTTTAALILKRGKP